MRYVIVRVKVVSGGEPDTTFWNDAQACWVSEVSEASIHTKKWANEIIANAGLVQGNPQDTITVEVVA